MDQQAHHAPSPSPSADQSHRRPHLNQQGPHSPSPGPYGTDAPSPAGLGLALDQPQHPHQQHRHSFSAVPADSAAAFDPSASFGHDPQSSAAADAAAAASPSFASQSQARPTSSFLSSNLADGDFSLFPSPGSHGDQLNASLFEQSTLSPNDLSAMTSPQSHHSPTPPNLLHLEANQPGSAQHSPSYSQHHFSPPGGHSRNVSLGPEAALLPNQVGDWTQPQFQGHRRSPSEYSEVSSVAPSPNIVSADAFEDLGAHSPLQRASDGNLYQEVLGIGNFSIADSSQGRHGRSPSHSPAISPRIQPQTPNMTNAAYGLGPSSDGFGAYLGMQLAGESFPAMQPSCGADVPQMAPPAINIDFAPNKPSSFELSKTHMDQDSLTPPDRGRLKSRPRSVTDPFHPGGPGLVRTNNVGSLSPAVASEFSTRSESARSLSPLDRQATSSPRGRRQSTSAVPNNVIALRLADPEYQGSQDAGAMKRVQKHPATFQCTLCPKRFTRAYNLRSHLRTHTDERPFVCTVCGKAFARQHDRKRHESLHSGEKKFVCKGDLKAGGQWGCGRRFARADALGRHFRSEAGRICIKPLLDEEVMERQRQWQEQRMQQNMAQNMAASQPMAMDAPPGYPMDAAGHYALPAALLAQYPALAQMNWSQADAGGAMDDDMSGRSSFDASDYDEADDGGYMSGPGTAFGEGSMNQTFGELGYGSDFGGR